MTGRAYLTAMMGVWLGFTGMAAAETAPGTMPASAPASQPADQMVLIRIGDNATITQADFEKAVRGNPNGWEMRDRILMAMVQDALLELYAKDHPDFVTANEIDAKLAQEAKALKYASVEAARKSYESRGGKWADHRRFVLLSLTQAKLAKLGDKIASDESKLKEIFEARKWEFDGTAVKARQIFFYMPVYATPEERDAIRKKLAQMREDILTGKRTWEQCVKESNSAVMNGELGTFPRHLVQPEVVAEAAFKLQPGQMSDVIESPLGYHLVQVTERVPPAGVSWDSLKKTMKRWIQGEAAFNAIEEIRQKYPMVGVQPPRDIEGSPATRPAPTPRRATSHPAPKRKAVFFGDKQPAWRTRSVTQTSPAEPATQPAKRK